jgi:CHAT domain-containing protein
MKFDQCHIYFLLSSCFSIPISLLFGNFNAFPQSQISQQMDNVNYLDKQEFAKILFNKCENYIEEKGRLQEGKEICKHAAIIGRDILDSPNFQNKLNKKDYYNFITKLAIANEYIGQYKEAIQLYEQVIVFLKKNEHFRSSEYNLLLSKSDLLVKMGRIYGILGKYQEQLITYQQLTREEFQSKDSIFIPEVYINLGQYQRALDAYTQILTQDLSQTDKSIAFKNIGLIYNYLGDYHKSIDFSSQALKLAQSIPDSYTEFFCLVNIGKAYNYIGQYKQSLNTFEQAWLISRKLNDRSKEGFIISKIGDVYKNLGDFNQALEFYRRGLVIQREGGDRPSESATLSGIASLFQEQKHPEIAIVFYKQSINVREAIRKDISKLDKDIQKSYLATVESTYRNLADLLLKQDRILEAQQVLDLLKVEELNEYLRTPTRSEETEKGTALQTPEKTFIALAIEFDELQKRNRTNNITASEQERLNQLAQSEREQIKQFTAFLNSPIVQKLVDELRRNEEQQNLDIKNFRNIREDILAQHPNAVLLYPLILEDRLELILITAKTTPIRRTINIKREKLNQEITNFLAGLRDASSQDIQKPAQQMYTWLIKPFETELAELKIDTIIYAPDGQLRYIPLTALHDGKQWLVEKYRVNNITAASLTKFNKPPIATPKIFAGAFGNVNKQGFSGLPATLTEVKKIADRFPNTTTFIETAFTKNVTENNSNSYTVLHLATHGQLSSGKPEDSFILFGDGTKATIADIQGWNLKNVDLVILSACQSGLGSKLGNGVEILGLGYQMQAAGARMSIATLWKVSDVGTEKLMDAFYTAVKTGKVSNVEALRQAQVAMITDNYEGLGETRGIVSIEARPRSTSSTAPTKISHPYFWAAFILIGNGL